MAGEESLHYGRSPGRALQALYDQSNLRDHAGNQAQKKQSKTKYTEPTVQKSASEKLSWFASSPLLLRSPAREIKSKKKKSTEQRSTLFSARVKGLGGGGRRREKAEAAAAGEDEVEDPTSPTVSCIGQVKPCKSKAMPKVSYSGPSAHASSSSSVPSDLCRESTASGAGAISSSSPARFFRSPARGVHSTWASLFSSSPRKDNSASHCHGHEGSHENKRSMRSMLFGNHHLSASASSSYSVLASNSGDTGSQRNSFLERAPASRPHGAKHKSTYEQLPPLQSGICNIHDLKVSLEVVPETWLASDGERFRAGPARAQRCLPDRSRNEEDKDFEVLGGSVHPSTDHNANATSQSLCRAPCDGEAYTGEGASETQLKDAEKTKKTTEVSKKIFFLGSSTDSRKSNSGKAKKPGSDSDGAIDVEKKRFQHADLYENLVKSFGTLIVVGYELNEDGAKHELSGVASGEKLFAGAFQVSELHGAGRKYLEFIRSRSVTSHRTTVMRLQRCNSEPWKPSY